MNRVYELLTLDLPGATAGIPEGSAVELGVSFIPMISKSTDIS